MAKESGAVAHVTSCYFGFSISNPVDNPLIYSVSQRVNLLPILAYQKIYYDFFSNSQWEKHLAYSYNVDYWDGTSPIIPTQQFLRMRYANYPKDYYMGVLPNTQYGSVALLPSYNPSVGPDVVFAFDPSGRRVEVSNPAGTNSVETSDNAGTSGRLLAINTDLSALSIRATEYLQRWKEVVQFSSKDYSDQMAAQFGIKAPEYMGNHAHYIGGWSSVININEVLNTNLNTQDSQASIAGKGVGSNQGHTLTYDCG